ncbi:MAG: hypothetical protein JW780_07715 [Clostridiales bacterium]|nr:hypothetical protein [Clostridiales bacterium]
MNHEEDEMNKGISDEELQAGLPEEEKAGQETLVEQESQTEEAPQDDNEDLFSPKAESKSIPKSTAILSVLCVAIAALLVLTQFGVIGTIRNVSDNRSQWFATPEDAIRFFVESVRDNRFDRAVSAFAAEETATAANFSSQLEHVGSYYPLMQYNMPEQYAAYEPAVLAVGRGKAAGSTLQFAASLLLGSSYMETSTFSTDPETAKQEISAVMDQLDPSQLSDLTFIRADVIDPDYQNGEDYQAFIGERAEAFGYDAYTEYVALIQRGDQHYAVLFAMVSLDGQWKIYEMNSGLLQFSYAIAIPITEEDYSELI